MSVDDAVSDVGRRQPVFQFDRHAPDYRGKFQDITEELQSKCPFAWSDTHGGHWVAPGATKYSPSPGRQTSRMITTSREFAAVTKDHDPSAVRASGVRGGILEMDDPEHREFRAVLNPYLSPAAVKKWVPVIDEVIRACLDEKIETGRSTSSTISSTSFRR